MTSIESCCQMASHQAILGLGHPATVQCRVTVWPSQTVCPRGLMINSGGCVRLSGFIFLRNSTHSSTYGETEMNWGVRFKDLAPSLWGTGKHYRLAQLHSLCRFPHSCCSGLLLHLDVHSLPGLPDKQVPHGHILNPLLWHVLLLSLHQTTNSLVTDVREKQWNNELTSLLLLFISCVSAESRLTKLWTRVSHNQELPCPYPLPGRCVWLFWVVGSALSPPAPFLSSQTPSGFKTITTKFPLQNSPKIRFQYRVMLSVHISQWVLFILSYWEQCPLVAGCNMHLKFLLQMSPRKCFMFSLTFCHRWPVFTT